MQRNTNNLMNQTMPVMNAPPGLNPYMHNAMSPFETGINFGGVMNSPPKMMAYPMSPNGIVESFGNTGRLKFFDEVQNYGFIVVDGDESDLFVHYDDLKTSKLSRDILRQAKTNYFLQFSFDIVKYVGKHKESRKAVNLKLIKVEKLGLIK